MSYTPTLTTEELTMIILAAEDRGRDLRAREKTARDNDYAFVNIDQLGEAAAEYEALVLKLRRLPRNSDALDALLRAGEADRAPMFPNH